MGTAIRQTFAAKFERALQQKRETDSGFGVRTVARALAGDDKQRSETVRRRLNKYRTGEVSPTEPTRHEIEKAMGLERDSLKPDDEDDEADQPVRRVVIPVEVSLDYVLLAQVIEQRSAAREGQL